MRNRAYYSVRTGKHPTAGKFNLPMLRKLFHSLCDSLRHRGYFQEYFGCTCDANNAVRGKVDDVNAFVFRRLKKQALWPPYQHAASWTEEDIFDLIELLYECVSKGVGTYTEAWNCEGHFEIFNRSLGQQVFREETNDILGDYGTGFCLNKDGEIAHLPADGMADLENAPLPESSGRAVIEKVDAARRRFRNRGATWDERRAAVRDLADALEYLREEAKNHLLNKDERDLFELANRFGIRHHDKAQQTDYDRDIWFSWMFYYYLSTIHALSRMIERNRESAA
jgi:hypothetical protein